MLRKYEVTSANSLIPMSITFNKIEDGIAEPITVRVSVDYANSRVYFDLKHSNEWGELDYEDLEQEILAHLRPSLPDAPQIPPEMMQRIADVRAGNYGNNAPKFKDIL